MDMDWKQGLLNVRIRNKAVIARLLNKMPGAEVPIKVALATATYVEKHFYTVAINEHEYQRRVSEYIDIIPKTEELAQAVLDVTSLMGELHRAQLCPYFLEGRTSQEALTLRVWILLESLSWFDARTRAQVWPSYETYLTLSQCHIDTIIAARQKLEQQPQPQRLFIFVNDLLHIVERMFNPEEAVQQQPLPQQPLLPPQPPQPQQLLGGNEYQNQVHLEVMAFLDQIK